MAEEKQTTLQGPQAYQSGLEPRHSGQVKRSEQSSRRHRTEQDDQPGRKRQTEQDSQSARKSRTGQSGRPGQKSQTGQSDQSGQKSQTGQSGQSGQKSQTVQSGQSAQKSQTGQSGQSAQKPQTVQSGQSAQKPQKSRQSAENPQSSPKSRQGQPSTERNRVSSGKYSSNRPEIIVSCSFFLVLFAVLIGYLGYFTATSEQEMINNSYNSRQEILLSRNYRGTIFSRDGEVLAETVLDSEQNETRKYPYGKLFAHAVGYSTQGRTGVEALANYYLINTNTSLSNKAANDMAGVKNPGDNVYTTLDVQIQEAADSELNIYRGAIIVTEVSTGKVLAMVSHPGFDPNEIQDIWDSLVENDASSVLLNRTTQGLYPPGSTFKIVTALEYIRENPASYDQYSFNCPGYFTIDDSRINCYHGSVHGQVDFTRSFAKSCNASFANIGTSLDREAFADTLEDLLFGRELPLTLSCAKSSAAVSADTPPGSMMQISIGQGTTQITPMHLNMITCAIANDGVLMKPYLIDRVENDAGHIIKSFKPAAYGRLMSEEEAKILTQLMTAVVENGTASRLSGLTYTAAGKTGSAEYNNTKGDSHAWFTGFAPAEDPEVCVTIIVEGAGSGGDYAVPIAKRIFDTYFNEK